MSKDLTFKPNFTLKKKKEKRKERKRGKGKSEKGGRKEKKI